MLAMDSRTPRGIRFPALSLTTIASMLAPTGNLLIDCRSEHARDGLEDAAGRQVSRISVTSTASVGISCLAATDR
jgi:hypothetical protein